MKHIEPTEKQIADLKALEQREIDAFQNVEDIARSARPIDESEAASEWFHILAIYLKKYAETYHENVYLAPHAFDRAHKILDAISYGNKFDVLTAALRPMGNMPWPKEQNLKAAAIFYCEFVKAKKPIDRKPMADAFNVTDKTIRNWLNNKEVICRDIDRPEGRDVLVAAQIAGRKYQRFQNRRKSHPK